MKKLSCISVAAVCALGMSAAMAQSTTPAQPAGGKHIVAQAPAPVQVAQAGAAGGAAGGATTTGVMGGVGVAGTVGSTIVFVGSAVAAVGTAAGASNPTTSH